MKLKTFKRVTIGIVSAIALLWVTVFSAAFVQLGSEPGLISKVIYRTSDATPVNNSTVFVADDTLKIPISGVSGQIYDIEAVILHRSSTVADIKYQWTVPAGTTLLRSSVRVSSTGGSCAAGTVAQDTGDATTFDSSAGVGVNTTCMYWMRLHAVSGATPGNLTLEWAQNTAEATDTKVLANSRLFYRTLN